VRQENQNGVLCGAKNKPVALLTTLQRLRHVYREGRCVAFFLPFYVPGVHVTIVTVQNTGGHNNNNKQLTTSDQLPTTKTDSVYIYMYPRATHTRT
jgi:hypothetical protein